MIDPDLAEARLQISALTRRNTMLENRIEQVLKHYQCLAERVGHIRLYTNPKTILSIDEIWDIWAEVVKGKESITIVTKPPGGER